MGGQVVQPLLAAGPRFQRVDHQGHARSAPVALEPCVRWLFGYSQGGVPAPRLRPVDHPWRGFGLHARSAHVRLGYLVRQPVGAASPAPAHRKRGHAFPPGHLPVALRVPQAGILPSAHRPSAGEAGLARALPGAVFGAGSSAPHSAHGMDAQLRTPPTRRPTAWPPRPPRVRLRPTPRPTARSTSSSSTSGPRP